MKHTALLFFSCSLVLSIIALLTLVLYTFPNIPSSDKTRVPRFYAALVGGVTGSLAVLLLARGVYLNFSKKSRPTT